MEIKFRSLKRLYSLIGLLIISLISIIVYTSTSILSVEEFLKSLALAVFSSSVVIFFYEVIYIVNRGDKYFEEIIEKRIPVYFKMKSSGMENISYEFELASHEPSFESRLKSSQSLTIVMNDGKRFIDNHSSSFRQRFKEGGKETNFILLDPRAKFVDILNKKHVKGEGYYENKILSVIDDLLNGPTYEVAKGHQMKIYLHDSFNTMSIVILDNVSIISPYRISPGKFKVPHIEFQETGNECEFKNIKDDVDQLLKKSFHVTKDNLKEIKKASVG